MASFLSSLLFQFGRLLFESFLLLSFIAFSPFLLFLFFFLLALLFLLSAFLDFFFFRFLRYLLLLERFWLAARNITFTLDITATYFLSDQLETAATFARRLHLPAHAISSEATRAAVLAALSDLHVVGDADSARMSSYILCYCNYWVPRCLNLNGRRGFNHNWILAAHYDLYVDKLPPVTDFYVGASPPDLSDHYFVGDDDDASGDDGIRFFLRATEESIAGLEKEKIEKSLTCAVCLIEASIGSEFIRLPCSHRYHAKCILPWLGQSNLCPCCRFELP